MLVCLSIPGSDIVQPRLYGHEAKEKEESQQSRRPVVSIITRSSRQPQETAMLKPSKIRGSVDALLINRDRRKSLATERVDHVEVGYEGFKGDAHGGLTRPACSRVKLQYAEGTEIRNTRQISILSAEELGQIASNMQIERLEPEWVGANLLLSGIPALSLLPPSTRLIFGEGVSLVVDMENGPCKYPGEIIDQTFPGYGNRFPQAARHLRGVTAWVEKEGSIAVGETVSVHLPVQPPYPHTDG